jgi:hypothetical protein
MGMFYNFTNVELVRIGQGQAGIVDVGKTRLDYLNEAGERKSIDLEECARIFSALERAGFFPPGDDTDWAAIADSQPKLRPEEIGGAIGLRARMDDPPWFQFLNRRRTQFEFRDAEQMNAELMTPLLAAQYGGSWDAS